MRDLLEDLYSAAILSWAEPTDDGERYAASVSGRLFVADTAFLLLTAIITDAVGRQPATRQPLRLAA